MVVLAMFVGFRIGVLMAADENDPQTKTFISAFIQGLADFGWTDGRNVRIDFRWAGGDINRIRPLARELVGLQSDIILTGTTAGTVALQRETRTIPIVFAAGSDLAASGIVPRLDRPSGNITGFDLEASLGGKWLELLSEIAPGLKRAAIMRWSRRWTRISHREENSECGGGAYIILSLASCFPRQTTLGGWAPSLPKMGCLDCPVVPIHL
jgi:ABC-type uncharacterized transport system substrate-binding protein